MTTVNGSLFIDDIASVLNFNTPVPDARRGLFHTAAMVHSENIPEAAIGMAAIDSLLDIDKSMYCKLNARELIVEKGNDGNLAMIGHLPSADYLRRQVKELWIIEKNRNNGNIIRHECCRITNSASVRQPGRDMRPDQGKLPVNINEMTAIRCYIQEVK